MEVWAMFGMGIVGIFLFMFSLWVTNKVASKVGIPDSWTGGILIGVAMAYASYVTWAITSGNVPFLTSG